MNLVVIGLGYVGLPLAISAAKSGHTVYGYDLNQEKVSELQSGKSFLAEVTKLELLALQAEGRIHFISELVKLDEKSIFVIAVPTPLDSNKSPDVTMLKEAINSIANVVVDDCLIINESTSYIGTLRNLIKPLIDTKSKLRNLKYAVAPERIDPGNKKWFIKNTPRLVSGITEEAKKEAISFYESFCDEICEVSLPEVAEAAKLFENTFRQVNIALVNEFSEIANKLNFSSHEAIVAAATKPFGFMPFYPSVGVGGHCIPVDPSYLSYSAKMVGAEAKLIDFANQINSSMPVVIVERVKDYLGGSLIGKRVQIAGITYKPDTSDLRESPALDLIHELRAAGALVSWHDPFVSTYEGQRGEILNSEIDLGLIVTPHSQIDLNVWKNANVMVLDLSANANHYGWPKFL
jgi:UDP-N-acetyl-D-glucosamine dehydrogenase